MHIVSKYGDWEGNRSFAMVLHLLQGINFGPEFLNTAPCARGKQAEDITFQALAGPLPDWHIKRQRKFDQTVNKDLCDFYLTHRNGGSVLVIELDNIRNASQVAKKFVSRSSNLRNLVKDGGNRTVGYITLCYPGTNKNSEAETHKYLNYLSHLAEGLGLYFAAIASQEEPPPQERMANQPNKSYLNTQIRDAVVHVLNGLSDEEREIQVGDFLTPGFFGREQQYSLLKRPEDMQFEHARYYVAPVEIGGQQFRFCNDIHDYHEPAFEDWITSMGFHLDDLI